MPCNTILLIFILFAFSFAINKINALKKKVGQKKMNINMQVKR